VIEPVLLKGFISSLKRTKKMGKKQNQGAILVGEPTPLIP
jgi:hypothetical protein